MIRFLKIVILVIVSCFLTTGHAFASIQAAQEAVSCCKSTIEQKDCCKNKATNNHKCDNSATCDQLLPSIVLFSEKTSEGNVQSSQLNAKNQPDTWVQLYFTSPFVTIWLPPQIGLNL